MDDKLLDAQTRRRARRALANRLVELRGLMSRQRAGRLLGERLERSPLSAARIGNFEQPNYLASLPSESQLKALAEIYCPESAEVIESELIELLRKCQVQPEPALALDHQFGSQAPRAAVQASITEGRASAHELRLKAARLLTTNSEPDLVTGLALLRRACELDHEYAEAHALIGYALWRRYFSGWDADLGTLERALRSAIRALELDDRSTAARMTLIRIHWDLGLHERGVAEGITAVHETPESVEAMLALARALNNAGMADLSFPITQGILQREPTNAAARKLIVWNHLMLKQYEDSIRAAHDYADYENLDANTAWAATAALCWLGEERQAERLARKALGIDAANFPLWLLLGYARRLSGDREGAKLSWMQGLRAVAWRLAEEKNHRAAAWLANMQAGIGAESRARDTVTRIRTSEPTNGYLNYRLAHVAAELGRLEEALTLLREAVDCGFLSVQLMHCEELCALSVLIGLPEYISIAAELEQKVDALRSKYAPLLPVN